MKTNVTNLDFVCQLDSAMEFKAVRFFSSFKGNPKEMPAKDWVRTTDVPDCPDQNNYVTMAVFKPGSTRATKENFLALPCFAIDDVGLTSQQTNGCKLKKLYKVLGKPNYVIETSQNNAQCWYLFDSPMEDKDKIARLEALLKKLGLTDPGAGGFTTRLMRLPVGLNLKYDRPYKVRLLGQNLSPKYSAGEILERLEKEAKKRGLVQQLDNRPRSNNSAISNMASTKLPALFIPKTERNALLEKLEQDHLIEKSENQVHHIKCPWEREHNNESGISAIYFEPSSQYPYGGFNCTCSLHKKKTIMELMDSYNISPSQMRNKATIRLAEGETAEINKAIDFALRLSKRSFRMNSAVVLVDCKTGEIVNYDIPTLNQELSKLVYFEKYRKDKYQIVSVPDKVLSDYLYCRQHPYLQELEDVSPVPVLLPDGFKVCPGYDKETKTFGIYSGEEYDFLKIEPSEASKNKSTAIRYLQELKDLLKTLEFETENDKAAALGALFTATIRGSLSLSPAFHLVAPTYASGKGYLSSLIIQFLPRLKGKKRDVVSITFPATNDEFDKKFFSARLGAGKRYLYFDNLTQDAKPFSSMCSAITSTHIQSRVLCKNLLMDVSTKVLMLLNGNNIELKRDLVRRFVPISLVPSVEEGALRQLDSEPIERVSKSMEYQKKIMFIIQAYLKSGFRTQVQALASFSEWSHYVREPLVWLGEPDPANTILNNLTKNPEKKDLGRILSALYDIYKNRSFKTSEVAQILQDENSDTAPLWKEALKEQALQDINIIDNQQIGYWFKNNKNKIAGKFQLKDDDRVKSSVRRYKIEKIR